MLQIQIQGLVFGQGVFSLSAPTAANATGTRTLTWSISGTQPTTALVEQSLDGITGWTTFATVAWSPSSILVNSGYYYRVTGVTVVPVTAPSSPVLVPLHPTAVTWAAQVVTNGGAAAPYLSISANSDFCYDIDAVAGLTNALWNVNTYSTPGNIIGAMTPLIHRSGPALWTNHNFLNADITVQGLQGNGTNKYADTGVIPTDYATKFADGIWLYVQGNNGTSVPSCQVETGSSNPNAPVVQMRLYYCETIHATMHCTEPGGGAGPDMIAAASAAYRGYIGATRTALNVRNLYLANTTTPHFSAYTDAVTDTVFGTGPASTSMPVFCSYETVPVINPSNFSKKRHSFIAYGVGLVAADSLALYNAIVTLRTRLGGGLDTGPNTP